jgi:hypothetical protein
MSQNNKKARLLREARVRSAARKNAGPKAEGGEKRQGRATAPKHGKTKAWWQRGTYAQFIRGGGKTAKRDSRDSESSESVSS